MYIRTRTRKSPMCTIDGNMEPSTPQKKLVAKEPKSSTTMETGGAIEKDIAIARGYWHKCLPANYKNIYIFSYRSRAGQIVPYKIKWLFKGASKEWPIKWTQKDGLVNPKNSAYCGTAKWISENNIGCKYIPRKEPSCSRGSIGGIVVNSPNWEKTRDTRIVQLLRQSQ